MVPRPNLILVGVLMTLILGPLGCLLNGPGVSGLSSNETAGPDLRGGQNDGTLVRKGAVELARDYSAENSSNVWTDMDPDAPPRQQSGAVMAFDEVFGVMVLFCGGGDGALAETWTYNVSNNTWTEMNPPTSPPARFGAAMAFDPENGAMVLFGGVGDEGLLGDTWSYNLSANDWTRLFPAEAPGARNSHAMAFDEGSGLMVLFGGDGYMNDGSNNGTGSNVFCNDTWTYDLASNAWTNMNPSESPSGRYCPDDLVYDAGNGVMVLYGGSDASSSDVRLSDTWTYEVGTNTWTEKAPANTPPALENHELAFDRDNGVVVLFGGDGNNPNNQSEETWIYVPEDDTWMNMTTANRPSNRNGMGGNRFCMAYDTVNKVTVLFGGLEVLPMPFASTYTYALSGWQYCSEGEWTSQPIDAGGKAFYGNLEWEASVPPGTSIGFRLRAAGSREGLNSKNFTGPDGTESTRYDLSGQEIAAVHDGSRWIQYRAFLATGDPSLTPSLKMVKIHYNLAQGVSITSPGGGENWTGVQDIKWTASDEDNDTLSFDIYLVDGDGATVLTSGLAGDISSWAWNTTAVQAGRYKVRVVARDANPTIPVTIEAVSNEIDIYHPPPDHEPVILSVLTPDNATVKSSSVLTFSVNASDPEGDELTYEWQENGATLGTEPTLKRKFPAGNHTLVLLIGDGRHLTRRTFNFTVAPSPGTTDAGPVSVPGFGAGLAAAAVATAVTVGLFSRRERR